MDRILIIQTAFLGDVILSTPVIRAIKNQIPESEIDVLVIPETVSVFQHSPFVRDILCFDKRKWNKKGWHWLTLIFKLRKREYSHAVSLHTSLTSGLLMKLAGIPLRIGFAKQKCLTHPVVHPKGMHMRHRYLALTRAFGVSSPDDQTEIHWTPAEEKRIDEIILQNNIKSPAIGIAPGSVWPTKRWPQRYFTQLTTMIAEAGAQVVLIGGSGDRQLCDEIVQHNPNVINVAGQLSIPESAALIKRLTLLVCNDSAPLHMADAVKLPVFAIFGPTVQRFGCTPYQPGDRLFEIDLPCRPCGKHGGKRCPEKHFRCMTDQKPDMVFSEILSFLKSRGL